MPINAHTVKRNIFRMGKPMKFKLGTQIMIYKVKGQGRKVA